MVDETEADGDEINAAACGWSCGCSVNPIVAGDVAAATLTQLIIDTVAIVYVNISTNFSVVRIIRDALKLVRRWLNIVATFDILSFLNPPVRWKKREIKKNILWVNGNDLNCEDEISKFSTILDISELFSSVKRNIAVHDIYSLFKFQHFCALIHINRYRVEITSFNSFSDVQHMNIFQSEIAQRCDEYLN